jgi:asparagine synthase (glutamine-hydrolysing)
MCGITGFVDRAGQFEEPRPEVRRLLAAMCDTIRHRGPDEDGYAIAEGAALGMRRLSIIDVEGGHQPVANEDGTIEVVFNGEIYNYRELGAELAALGHTLASDSDTNVIVHAYEEWGERAFSRLRGMFAIAIWDGPRRTLLLARDQVGIKPLFFAESPRRLVFGSEIKAILASGEVQPAIDVDALDHYLSYLYTPPDHSIYTGIRKLPPGHFLRWRNGQTAVRAYWTPPADEAFRGSEDDAAEMLRLVLEDSVKAHLVSDVPVGAFLSGGLDSSVVVALMARASSRPVTTFSIGFDEARFDELDAARTIARHFGTVHHQFVVRPDAIGVLDDLIDHFDEPFADVSAIPTWYVSRMARQHVTVALTGDGGDELFGGYDRYLPPRKVERFDRWAGSIGRRLAGTASRWLPDGTRGQNLLRHVSKSRRERYVETVAFFRPHEKTALLTPDLQRAIDTGRAERALGDRFDRYAHLDWSSQMMRVDFETYLPEDVLTKVDRMSMAHSIESRVPLLDRAVIGLAASLPSSMKILGRERKRVFRRVATSLLPPEALSRGKQGFGVPIGLWFRGRLRDLFTDVLQSARTRQRGFFESRYVDRLVREHLTGARTHNLRLWQLVVFELWLRRYVDGGRAGALRTDALSVP